MMIEASGLYKCYGPLAAVDHIDFSVRKQECFGFLGPNGAGKTTTARMVSCFLEPSGGKLEVMGKDVRTDPRYVKRNIGVCPQEDNLDPDLSAADNLRVYARYFDIKRREAEERSHKLLEFMGLTAKSKARIDELSGGMKRRLVIARALINRPRILILDEPTTGLDPQARHQIWESLHKLKEEGTTIVLTTHYMDEAAHLCDRLVVMDHGKIMVKGSPRNLIKELIGNSVVEIARRDDVEPYLKSKGLTYERTQTHYYIHGDKLNTLWPEISRKFGEEYCLMRMANLEDVFLKLTGRALREL
jgi:lipooligosaccharide transport system ATP-binding protein